MTALPVSTAPATTRRRYHRNNGDENDNLSKLERYFFRPTGHYTLHDGSIQSFDDLTYLEYYNMFRLDKYRVDREGLAGVYLESPSTLR